MQVINIKKRANDDNASASGHTLGASVNNETDTAYTVNKDTDVHQIVNNETDHHHHHHHHLPLLPSSVVGNETDTAHNVNNDTDVDQIVNNETEAAQNVNNVTDVGDSSSTITTISQREPSLQQEPNWNPFEVPVSGQLLYPVQPDVLSPINPIQHQPSDSCAENNVASARFNGADVVPDLAENDPQDDEVQDNGQAAHGLGIAVQEIDRNYRNDISLHMAAPGHEAPHAIPGDVNLHVSYGNNTPIPIPEDVDIHDDQDDLLILGVHSRF